MQLLLEGGAAPDSLSEFGMTPLMIAVQNGSKDLVALLLSYHASPLRQNVVGQNACQMGQASADADMRALFRFCPAHPAKE